MHQEEIKFNEGADPFPVYILSAPPTFVYLPRAYTGVGQARGGAERILPGLHQRQRLYQEVGVLPRCLRDRRGDFRSCNRWVGIIFCCGLHRVLIPFLYGEKGRVVSLFVVVVVPPPPTPLNTDIPRRVMENRSCTMLLLLVSCVSTRVALRCEARWER